MFEKIIKCDKLNCFSFCILQYEIFKEVFV